MICQECGWDNQAKQLYCMNCGVKIEMDFDAVEENMLIEIRNEREQATSGMVQQYFAFSVFALFLLLIFRSCVASDPPQPRVLPRVQSTLDEVQDKDEPPIDPVMDFEFK